VSKNLHEPSTERKLAAVTYSEKMTRQKPEAFQWVTPVNDADCGVVLDPVWTPCYTNDWEQPTTLEPLSVRVNADGSLQWQGYANSQNSTDPIAFFMPGTFEFEPDMLPPDNENLSYTVYITPDDGLTVQRARAYVDAITGEVSIYPDAGFQVFRRRRRADQTIGSGGLVAIDFDDSDTNTAFFQSDTVSGEDSIKVLQGGLYSVLARICIGVGGTPLEVPFAISLNYYPDANPDIYPYVFSVGQLALDYEGTGAAGMDIRLEENQEVTLLIVHEAGGDRTIGDGTFLEVRYLGPINLDGLDWP
jgi:hypothetical protein